MGGRGSSSSSGGTGGVSASDIISTSSLVSARETNQTEVDEALSVFNDVYNQYGSQVADIQLAKMVAGSSAMAYYDAAGNIAINESYFDSAKMTAAYDQCVKSGFHPGRGKKTAMQAVTAHELGHKLTADVGARMGRAGFQNIDSVSTRIVNEAMQRTGSRNASSFARRISGYATHNRAETIAEAFSDVYCNGSRAKAESRAVVDIMNGYLK